MAQANPETQANPAIAAFIEAERSAIAAEIHDGLLPYLYAAAAKLSAIRRSSHTLSPGNTLDERLADAAEWIDRSREIARALMNEITYPPQALADPLVAAQGFLNQFADPSTDLSAGERSPVICWQWGDGPSPLADQLSGMAAIAVYRLTTEFVRNALRHAGADRIEISASFASGVATIQIRDDGCGFPQSEVDFTSSHGLALARRRAEAAGIEMQLESSDHTSDPASPTGTRVTLRTTSAPTNEPHEQIQHPQQAHP